MARRERLSLRGYLRVERLGKKVGGLVMGEEYVTRETLKVKKGLTQGVGLVFRLDILVG